MSSPPPHLTFDFAAKVRNARIAANLTQVEFAERLKVAVRTVQGWEAGTFPQPRHRRLVLAFIDGTAQPEDGQVA